LSEIRCVEERDLARLEGAYPELGRPASRHRARWALQEQGEGVYLVAWQGDLPIGWVFVHRPGSSGASEHARRLDVAEIMDLWVADPFRGLGHGSSLLLAAEDVAVDAGWLRVGLEVTVSNPHNDVARAMYERHGYTDAGFGEFQSGYTFWTEEGERRWAGEPHRYLVRSLSGLEPERSGSARRSITSTVPEGSPSATTGTPDEGDER
jgi:GNAT superfamily N-acetyltransferase